MESHLTDITRVIQLAVAPVFLLTAIATLITALNNRLGRIVDRRRVVLNRLEHAGEKVVEAEAERELCLLARRIKIIYFAVFAAVMGALMVCLVVAGAFIGALLAVELAKMVAIFFIFAMLALIVCLGLFLREIFLAVTDGTHRHR